MGRGSQGGHMARMRIGLAAALALGVMIPALVSTAAAREVQCTHTLAQYNEAISMLEAQAAQARSLAERNPLYESDVAYFASVLADAKHCVKTLSPVATAAR